MASRRREKKKIPKHPREMIMETSGFGWRVSLSIIVSMLWLAFLVIWLFFYAQHYNIYQNIAVFLASILVNAAIHGSAWAPWGIRYGWKQKRDWERYDRDRERYNRTASRRYARRPRSRTASRPRSKR